MNTKDTVGSTAISVSCSFIYNHLAYLHSIFPVIFGCTLFNHLFMWQSYNIFSRGFGRIIQSLVWKIKIRFHVTDSFSFISSSRIFGNVRSILWLSNLGKSLWNIFRMWAVYNDVLLCYVQTEIMIQSGLCNSY